MNLFTDPASDDFICLKGTEFTDDLDKFVKKPKSNTASEITVTIRDDEKNLKAKYLIYEEYTVSHEDETLKRCIAETLRSFEGDPTDIRIRINLSL